MSKLTDLAALSAAVPSGARIAVGGFQLSRVPVTLLRAIVARGTERLAAVCAPNPWALETLAAGEALHSADSGFIGFQYEGGFVIPPALRRAIAAGRTTLRQRDVLDTIEEFRRPAGAPRVDFALLHAQRADRAGNLEIADPYADVVLAGGAARVLATVEQVVDRIEQPTIAGDHVDGIAEVPGGAAPTACYGYYGRDTEALDAWLAENGSRRRSAGGTKETTAPATNPGRRAEAPAANAGGRAKAAQQSPTPRPMTAVDRRSSTSAAPGHAAAAEAADRRARADAFIVNLARLVRNDEVVVTGLASAIPMLAIALAQRLHAPRARYINCVGAVNPRLESCWPTSVEPALLNECESTIDLPGLFDLADAGGIDAMFFGAAQIDAAGNINLTRIGDAAAPRVRLPGPAGSPSMRARVRRVLIAVPRQSARNLVEAVDTVTSAPAPRNRETTLVTDLARWQLRGGRLRPTGLAPGTDLETLSRRTGFALGAAAPASLDPPTELELAALRRLDGDQRRYRMLGVVPEPRPRRDRSEALIHER